MIGSLALLRDRALVLGYLEGSLMILGSFFHGAIVGFALVTVPLVQRGGEEAQLMALTEALYEHAAFIMLLIPFAGFFLGLILLAIALWRAQVAPLWVSVLLLAAVIAEFFGPEAISPELMLVLLLIGFGWLGLKVLRMSNAQWAGLERPSHTEVVANNGLQAPNLESAR